MDWPAGGRLVVTSMTAGLLATAARETPWPKRVVIQVEEEGSGGVVLEVVVILLKREDGGGDGRRGKWGCR